MRKKLLQYIKTRHFKERQKERSLSDAKIKEAILKGEISERDGLTVFKHKNIEIVASEEDVLITIINKGTMPPAQKALTKEQAAGLKQIIKGPKAEIQTEAPAPRASKDASSEYGETEIDLEAYLRGDFHKREE